MIYVRYLIIPYLKVLINPVI